MGHDKLRNDNECQNCGHTVTMVYCGHCGQKNIETRQSFGHLISHFAEDLTHYDSAFWKTIKYLLFRPAQLTTTYLDGRRQTYVPPVKLYIFISFITFLLLGLISHRSAHGSAGAQQTPLKVPVKIQTSKGDFTSEESLIAYQAKATEENKLSAAQFWFSKKMIALQKKEINGEEILEAYTHTLPKVLFIYMPIFAFWLWLFHGKKRWYFFDHGIFTFHFFSFLLLITTFSVVLNLLLELILSEEVHLIVSIITSVLLLGYIIFYFFRAHSKMYGERKIISRFKSVCLLFINLVCITTVMLFALFYILFTLH